VTTDHALDVIVDPDGTWQWKDEDDLTEAQALGVFTLEQATAIRAEGERVIAAKPWPTGWEDWRP
jgi:predicted RNA-binding protein associated with RNAse of E/G family